MLADSFVGAGSEIHGRLRSGRRPRPSKTLRRAVENEDEDED